MTAVRPRQGRYDRLVFYMDVVGHDIIDNNQAALGCLELMLASPRLDKATRSYAEKVFTHLRTSTVHVENCKRLIATETLEEDSLRPLDVRCVLQRSQKEMSGFFLDRQVRVRLARMPKPVRVLGDSLAEALILNTIMSAIRMVPGGKAEVRVSVAPSVFRGRACWTITIDEPRAVLPASLKGKDFKSVYLLDSSAAVKLSGVLFSRMMAEALGGDFDAYELPDTKGGVGVGFTITLRRGGRK